MTRQLRSTDVRTLSEQIATLDRDAIDGTALYKALDELYDALLEFFNQEMKRDG